ncbi:MAG: redoxin domain-containing protein [Planctomycetes bacterium]|nr:redoxin domain-containing protein [Planctomycetota bacterium]
MTKMTRSRRLSTATIVSLIALSAIGSSLGTSMVRANPLDRIGEKLRDVELRDLSGKTVKLLDFHKGNALVIAYTGLGCPISGRYAPRLEALRIKLQKRGVYFVGINANPQDKLDAIAADAKELGITFPMLQDFNQDLTKQLDAKTTTVAFLIDKSGTIRYRGMIDDQYAIGAQRKRPRNRHLERAIRAVLSGKVPDPQRTVAPGCRITRIKPKKVETEITYSSHIAKIIQDNCQKCHRPQQIAPFALNSFEAAEGWSAMIYSVLLDNRMPPWNAHEDFDGQFVNERKMRPEDKKMLLAWIENDMPRGNPEEDPPKKSWPGLWRIGRPDKVFTMKEAFAVPAEGVVEYQYFRVKAGYKKDRWLTALEARPGAADVVHHIVAFTIDPSGKTDRSQLGLLDGFLCAQVPGDIPSIFPKGWAKKLPAGHDLMFQVHYTTNGKKRKDKCKVAVIYADEPISHEVRTRGIINTSFVIPPGESNYEVRASYTLEEDLKILSLYPHMHFRGKDWTFLAHLPGGETKTLLVVPRYDYNWQESYVLKEPRLLPKGTTIECIAHFDNSSENFSNPDPTAAVRFGDQSWEEMMIGYFDYVVPVQGTE